MLRFQSCVRNAAGSAENIGHWKIVKYVDLCVLWFGFLQHNATEMILEQHNGIFQRL